MNKEPEFDKISPSKVAREMLSRNITWEETCDEINAKFSNHPQHKSLMESARRMFKEEFGNKPKQMLEPTKPTGSELTIYG